MPLPQSVLLTQEPLGLRGDAHLTASTAVGAEGHHAIRQCEEGVILTHAYIVARVNLGAALAHQDVACGDGFTTVLFNT